MSERPLTAGHPCSREQQLELSISPKSRLEKYLAESDINPPEATKRQFRHIRRVVVPDTIDGVEKQLQWTCGPVLADAILRANPSLFLDYQCERARFDAYVAACNLVVPKLVTVLSNGGTVTIFDVASLDGMEKWLNRVATEESALQERERIETILKERGFENPKLALDVLAKGCLVHGKISTVSSVNFGKNARAVLPPGNDVDSLKQLLIGEGLLEQVGKGGLCVPLPRSDQTNGRGDIDDVLRWLRRK